MRAKRGAIALACALLASACSLIFPADESQCETDADCAARGFANATCSEGLCVAGDGTGGAGGDAGGGGTGGAGGQGPWDCLDEVVWATEDQSKPAQVRFRALTLLGQQPFEGLEVQVCPQFDPQCQNPGASAFTDADGFVTLDVHVGFRGHFFAAPPPSFPEAAPTLIFQFPPPTEELFVVDGNLNITSIAEMETIAALASEEITPGTGHLFFTAIDCDGEPTEGISVVADTVSPTTTPVYISETGTPSATLPGTSTRGEGAMINLPSGFVTITATSEDAGKVFEATVIMAADSITGIPIVPSPL